MMISYMPMSYRFEG